MDLLERALNQSQDAQTKFSIEAPVKGLWSHASPLSCPPSTFPLLNNVDLPAGVITTMPGNEVFLDGAYPASTTINLLCDRRTTSGTDYLIAVQGAAAGTGAVYKWVTNAWVALRTGLTGIATAQVWWSWQQYGTDLYISNPYDGVYRYDGTSLVPIGSTSLAQMESTEAALWAGETADTTNFRSGTQSFYAETAAGDATMTYTPSVDLNGTTARYQGRAYLLTKAAGTDFFTFRVMFSDTGTINTTNTKVVITDTAAKSLTWPYTAWDSDRAGTAMPSPPVAGTWYTVYLKPTDATEVATFNPALIDTIAFTVSRSAGTLRMTIDDLGITYADSMPAVQFLAEWKNMLWGGFTLANPDALYFSPVQAPDEFTALATFPIKSRGQSITGLRNFYTQLMVGAENSIFSLSGSAQGSTYPAYIFDQQMVSREHGCSSHRSIVEANNRLYWFYQGMIVEYRGTGTTKLSYAIDPTLALADFSVMQYFVGDAFRAKNQIWWSWRLASPTVAATNEKVLRFDYINGAFLETAGLSTPFIYQTFASGIERLLVVDTTGRKVYRMASANLTFFGTNIVYTVDTPPLVLDDKAQEWDDAYLSYLSNTGDLTVQKRVSDHLRGLLGSSYATIETINQSTDGEFGKLLIGDRSTLLQFRFTSTAIPFQLQLPFIIWTRSIGEKRHVI